MTSITFTSEYRIWLLHLKRHSLWVFFPTAVHRDMTMDSGLKFYNYRSTWYERQIHFLSSWLRPRRIDVHKWGLHSMNWSVVFIVYGRLYGLYSWFEGWLWSLGTSYWRPRMVMGLSIPIHVKGEIFFTFSSTFPFIMAFLDGKTYSTLNHRNTKGEVNPKVHGKMGNLVRPPSGWCGIIQI